MHRTFEQLERRDMLTNPTADYPYVAMAGRLFHYGVQDIAVVMNHLTHDSLYENKDLQSIIVGLANNPYAAATGVDFRDAKQGVLNNSALIASMDEVAATKAQDITQAFTVNSNGTMTIRIFDGGTKFVTITPDLPANNGLLVYAGKGISITNRDAVLWPSYLEKAYAQYFAAHSYHDTEGLFSFSTLAMLTGQSTSNALVSDKTDFVNAFNAGECLCIKTPASEPEPLLVANQVYVVLDYNPTTDSILVMNPQDITFYSVSWAAVQQDFQSYDRTL